ncbi:RCC1 and BTB domain-containing protein 1-like [Planococcus citri]|uniref:RCC1 and BTB domain-containing protein 1-like n=1 Tax=Planococcus citri TaxID=170843 RepID=UPI0031F8EC11
MKITILDDPRFRHDNSISEQKDRCEIMIFQKDGDLIDHCKIEKLIGGYGHALALDEYGRLFQTGHYFLKKPSYIKYEHFELNSFITEKIVDIAACMTQHLSAALTESGKIYMWGKSRSEIIYPEPVLTAYKSLHEVFLYDAPDSLETYRPIHVDELSAVTSEPTTKPTTEPHIMPIESSMTDTLHSLTNSCETEFADPAETSKPINVDELSAVVTSEPTTELHIMPIESNMADTQHSLTNSFEKEFADPAETSKPINVDELSAIVTSEPHTMPIESSIPDTQHSLTDSFKKAFNDPKFCDLFVVVEGKTIPVHKSILAVRCEHFTEIFQKHWPIVKPSVLEIEDGDFKTYKAFLEYLYTDQINDKLSFNEIIKLLYLTNKYNEKPLAERCILLIQPNVTIENVVSLYEHLRSYLL